MDALKLTKDFINMRSITPDEQAFAEHVEQLLSDADWKVERIPAEENRWSLFASPMQSLQPKVVFCSHLDTVAPFISMEEDADYIYGRGSCDAKGVIACMIEAMDRINRNGNEEVGLLLTVGEEVDSIGAKTANRHAPDSVQYTIVGEPTENKLIIGQKGIYLIEIHTKGTSAHSAYPHLGDSAVNKLLTILQAIRETDLPMDSELGETTVNISRLSGGESYNVVPDSASAGLLFRVTTSTGEIEGVVRQAVENKGEFEVINKSEPQHLVKIPGFEQVIVAFGSDVPYLTNWGKRLMIGPGAIHDAHTDGEKISKAQMAEAVDKYMEIVHYLNENG